MKKTLWIGTLVCLVLLITLAQPALGAADWRAPFQNVLKPGVKRLAALCDLTGDGVPELAVLSVSKANVATLDVHRIAGDTVLPMRSTSTAFDMRTFSVPGVKSASMQRRVNASGEACLSIALTAKSGGDTVSVKLALKHESERELDLVYMARKNSAGQYQVDGLTVSQAQYDAAVKAFETAYKKKGNLPTATINAANGASAVKSRFNTLAKRYTTYSSVKKIKLSKSTASLNAGKTLALKATISPATAAGKLQWSSSDTAVATVDQNGLITAVAAGQAQIAAQAASGVRQVMTLTVTGGQSNQTPGVTLDETAMTLVKGETFTFKATVVPENNKITWSSSNASVVSVDQNGRIEARKLGKAVITAKPKTGKAVICRVVVNETGAVIVDISQHNYSTKMDWPTIAKNVDLLILRCGVTRTDTAPIGVGIDDKFAFYAQQCKKYGIPFGVYFYGKCSDVETAKKEAQLTWETASPYNPLFYVYDVEETRLTKQLIETYMKTLKALGAKKTGYYIAHHLYTRYNLDTSLVDFIWLPHYGKNNGKVNSSPSYPSDLHQYTSMGQVPGFPGRVDISRLMATKSLKWFLSR